MLANNTAADKELTVTLEMAPLVASSSSLLLPAVAAAVASSLVGAALVELVESALGAGAMAPVASADATVLMV